MDVATKLSSDQLFENLLRAGLDSLTSTSTVVHNFLEPPPVTSMQPPPSPASFDPPSALNEPLAPSEENPKFTTARFLGLFSGAMSMLLLSIAYHHRKKIVQSIFACTAPSKESRRNDQRKDRMGNDAQSAADHFIENACK